MKAWHWQVLIVLLCVWDTIATQSIIAANMTGEGNPLMKTVIETSGWIPVWAIKIGLGSIFAAYIPILWERLWGKPLVIIVFFAYLFVAFLHIFILQLPY